MNIDFAPAVMALGTGAFPGALLAALNRGVLVDHVSIMRFEDRARPPVIESAIWRGGAQVATVQRAYLERFYRFDPALRTTGRGHRILRLHRDDLVDADYWQTAYIRAGLLERLTVAVPDRQRLITLNLYRRQQGGPFVRRDLQCIEAQAPLLAALTIRHVGMIGALLRSRDRGERLAALATRLQALEPRLTRRELDVIARALAGHTSASTALDLGISINTVLTYRKRAYGRLGISSQAELFSRCLA